MADLPTLTDPLDAPSARHPTVTAFARAYANRLVTLLDELDVDRIGEVVEEICRAREARARIFLLGNGGSAATASHFANDLMVGAGGGTKPFRAISLADNTALLTCLANDFGYESVFVKQLEAQLEPGDVVIAISASGSSENVVRAVEFANARGNCTIAFVGFDGGRLLRIARTAVHIRTPSGEYGPVEDLHLVLDHLITAFLARRCASETERAAATRGDRR